MSVPSIPARPWDVPAPAPKSLAPDAASGPGPAWVYTYVAVQIACQLALLPSLFAPARILFRSAAFGISLAFLLLVRGKPLNRHPVRYVVVAVLGVIAVSAANPEGGSLLAVAASLAFNISVVGPVFWVARVRCDAVTLDRLLLMLWAFSTASAAVGLLQTYFPGQFQPNIAMLASDTGKRQIEGLMIRLSSGAWIPRPCGLTDTPGGAATGGLYAALLGIGVVFRKPFPFSRPLAAASILIGAMALYLCQIRALVVMLVVCVATMVVLLVISGRLSRMAIVAVAFIGLALLAMNFALSVGGDAVTQRLQTLVASDAATVYSNTRGSFLSDTLTRLLWEYPLGAGLGRWGMINQYFGGGERWLWVEIQWTAWLFDGGILLMIVYPVAILVVVKHAIQLAVSKTTLLLDTWACVVAGYGVGAFALTFSYAIFMSTSGIEFWLINAVLIQAAAAQRDAATLASAAPVTPPSLYPV